MDPVLGGVITAAVGAFAGVTIAYLRTANRKLDVIHVLVNSNLEKVKRDLKLALEKIELLEQRSGAAAPTKGRRTNG